MGKRTYEDKMRLEMPFGEALKRFAGTSPKEMHANIRRSKKKKPPGGTKKPPPGGSSDNSGVVSLRDRRQKRRNGR